MKIDRLSRQETYFDTLAIFIPPSLLLWHSLKMSNMKRKMADSDNDIIYKIFIV